MQDYEKMGVFYIGKEYDVENASISDELVLYKSKDLTTHAVIIGMTGSGKTGLGIGLLEEAAIDNIPVIAIDPKGDLGNMALTFPDLKPEDFTPWINEAEAENKGMSVAEYSVYQADMWKKGLSEWNQDEERIKMLKQSAEVEVYTPGSSAGKSVSVLSSLKCPNLNVKEDSDAYREKIHTTVTSLLALLGMESDPLSSKEYILLSNIIENQWSLNRDLRMEDLITFIQEPPIQKVGVIDIENFYPGKERFDFSMKINNLMASPSFKAWMEGEVLDADKFMYDEMGKPKISVFSIAHLQDKERMFFVTMLLNEILSWTRSQPGTSSLRAILYMDEVFGYLPPTANPPSKAPLLTLLKQARAFGLGLVLSTQNPVDLDYKALSNAGTWFIGRLQTERDKARVMDGLEGAAAGGNFERKKTERILSGLGQRVFYLHSVHRDEPTVFTTRWVLSYLAGPMTRKQLKLLTGEKSVLNDQYQAQRINENKVEEIKQSPNLSKPVLPPGIEQLYIPDENIAGEKTVYKPFVLGVADVNYVSAKYNINISRRFSLLSEISEGPIAMEWRNSEDLKYELNDLMKQPIEDSSYMGLPALAADSKIYGKWKQMLEQFLRNECQFELLYSPTLKVISNPEEDERDFKIRLQHLMHEARDKAVEDLKKKYQAKIDVLADRQRRARQTLEKQNAMANQRKMEAAVSAGTALLGSLFGKKALTATSISKVGTAVKSTGRALKSEGVDQARETLASVEAKLSEIEKELEAEIEKIANRYDLQSEKLEKVVIKTTGGNINTHYVGLAWKPI